MVDKVKIEAKIIEIPKGRAAFLRHDVPRYRTDKNGQEIKVNAKTGKPIDPKYSWTWLLDPSDAVIAKVIAEIKAEGLRQLDLYFGGRDKWPKDNPTTGTKGVIPCYGDANKLPKVYDGYKDMFYIKVSDQTRPIVGAKGGRQVEYVVGDRQWHFVDAQGNVTEEVANPAEVPYAGANCRGRISLYVYNNEQAGVNANARSIQFLSKNDAFGGGGGRRTASEELAQMAGDSGGSSAATGTDDSDPWG